MARKKFPMAVVDLDGMKETEKKKATKRRIIVLCPGCQYYNYVTGEPGKSVAYDCKHCLQLQTTLITL